MCDYCKNFGKNMSTKNNINMTFNPDIHSTNTSECYYVTLTGQALNQCWQFDVQNFLPVLFST